MAIPLLQLIRAKDLLLFSPLNTTIDSAIASEWDQQVATICRQYDLFTQVASITPIVNTAIYSVPVGTTRIFSILFRGVTLDHTDRGTLELFDPDWQTTFPGTPRYWLYNAVPGDTDSPTVTVTPREFLIHPAPDGANVVTDALTLILERQVETVPRWIEPAVLYLTVGKVAEENPNCMQPEKGQFFTQLGNLWLVAARKMMQI